MDVSQLPSAERTRWALKPIFDHCDANGLDIVAFVGAEYWDGKSTLKGMAERWGVTRITLTRFMDRNGIPRRTLSETQFMVAENPSPKQRAQRRRWQAKGREWMKSIEGRKANRIRALKSNPAKSLAARKKISAAKVGEGNWMYGRCGPLHHGWRGGCYKYNPDFDRIGTLILARDNYTCQICGETGNDVHHIDYRRKNNTVLNLITLCHPCHMGTNSGQENRAYWKERLTNLQMQRFDLPALSVPAGRGKERIVRRAR